MNFSLDGENIHYNLLRFKCLTPTKDLWRLMKRKESLSELRKLPGNWSLLKTLLMRKSKAHKNNKYFTEENQSIGICKKSPRKRKVLKSMKGIQEWSSQGFQVKAASGKNSIVRLKSRIGQECTKHQRLNMETSQRKNSPFWNSLMMNKSTKELRRMRLMRPQLQACQSQRASIWWWGILWTLIPSQWSERSPSLRT